MVTIPARFNGPDASGNGGWCAGLLAAEHGASAVTSTLRQPPPLETPLTWERTDDVLRLVTAGGAVVGEATTGSFTRDPMPTVDVATAAAAAAAYPGHTGHPFDRCFVCGPAREAGDGLRIFSGPIEPGSTTTAAPWVPQEPVDVPTTWAAIDCAGGWAVDFTVRPTVLGRMTAEVLRLPEVGEPCVVTGRLDEQQGRKFLTRTALHAGDELLARAEQVWIEIDPSTFS